MKIFIVFWILSNSFTGLVPVGDVDPYGRIIESDQVKVVKMSNDVKMTKMFKDIKSANNFMDGYARAEKLYNTTDMCKSFKVDSVFFDTLKAELNIRNVLNEYNRMDRQK